MERGGKKTKSGKKKGVLSALTESRPPPPPTPLLPSRLKQKKKHLPRRHARRRRGHLRRPRQPRRDAGRRARRRPVDAVAAGGRRPRGVLLPVPRDLGREFSSSSSLAAIGFSRGRACARFGVFLEIGGKRKGRTESRCLRSELVHIATLLSAETIARDPKLDPFFSSFHLTTLQVNVTRLWVTASSALLSFVFIFGNSLRGIYESVVFLFVVHPFDVGDVVVPLGGRLGVDHGRGDSSRVEGIRLLTTTLVRLSDGARGAGPTSSWPPSPS